jgi:hypothetical protein
VVVDRGVVDGFPAGRVGVGFFEEEETVERGEDGEEAECVVEASVVVERFVVGCSD